MAAHNMYTFPTCDDEEKPLVLRGHPATPSEISSCQDTSCDGEEEMFVNDAHVRAALDVPGCSGEDRSLGHNDLGNIALVECADGRLVLRGVRGTHVYRDDFLEFLGWLCNACDTAKLICVSSE